MKLSTKIYGYKLFHFLIIENIEINSFMGDGYVT